MKTRTLRLRSVQVVTVCLIAIGLIFGLMWTLAQVAGAQGPQLLADGGCPSGNDYDPACDVTHDGEINVLDVERVAGRWRTTGTYVETYWSLSGNAATNPITNFLGTTDAVDFYGSPGPDVVTGTFGTIGGGGANIAGFLATVGGGESNTASGDNATVAGGSFNTASDSRATVGG